MDDDELRALPPYHLMFREADRMTYTCCSEFSIDLDDTDALVKLQRHIHYHRMGTVESADNCLSCREFAEKKLDELRENA